MISHNIFEPHEQKLTFNLKLKFHSFLPYIASPFGPVTWLLAGKNSSFEENRGVSVAEAISCSVWSVVFSNKKIFIVVNYNLIRRGSSSKRFNAFSVHILLFFDLQNGLIFTTYSEPLLSMVKPEKRWRNINQYHINRRGLE